MLAEDVLAPLLQEYAREVVVDAVRRCLANARDALANGANAPAPDDIARMVVSYGVQTWAPWPVPVINATGVILHTNLGRAPLSEAAIAATEVAVRDYSDLELDLESGKRSSRHRALARLLSELTGAEEALVVNNNAGAMLLGLAAIAQGREVVVARGEAAEIGGGFRIPDVLRQSGALLTEVGTVNRTYAADYERAVTADTAALLVVHRSNFQVVGFTHEPELAEVAAVAAAEGVPLLHDLGSGALLDTAPYGLAHEPMPQESIAGGADLVFVSGDKLLGGPQAGIVVGRRALVHRLAEHPLARALRADKMTLAALHATLLHYLRGEAERKVPVWRMITANLEDIARRADAIAQATGDGAEVIDGLSTVGGGSLPGDTLPTRLVAFDSPDGAEALASRLRMGSPAILARIDEGRVLLDPRTVLPPRDAEVLGALRPGGAGSGD